MTRRASKSENGRTTKAGGPSGHHGSSKQHGNKEEVRIVPHPSSMYQLKLCKGSLRAEADLPDQTTPEAQAGTDVHTHLEHHFKDWKHAKKTTSA